MQKTIFRARRFRALLRYLGLTAYDAFLIFAGAFALVGYTLSHI